MNLTPFLGPRSFDGKRVHDIEEAPDGSLWMLEDADDGGLYHLTPK
jgi:glucose/arabinose dehydrogenase